MSAKATLIWLADESLPIIALRRLLAYAPTVHGRATRLELVTTVIIVLVVSAISFALFSFEEQAGPWQLLSLLQSLLLLLPIGSATIRRLHDTGRNGFALLVVAAPYIGALFLIGILMWDGDPNENRYGPPPA